MVDQFTVSELAELVAPVVSGSGVRSEDDIDLIIRRIRSWTLSGALKTVGDPHIWSGRHRRYGKVSIYVAAVLNVLAENDQSIATLLSVSQLIRAVADDPPIIVGEPLRAWQIALAGEKLVYLATSAIGPNPAVPMSGSRHAQFIVAEDNLAAHLGGLLGGVFVNLTATLGSIKPI